MAIICKDNKKSLKEKKEIRENEDGSQIRSTSKLRSDASVGKEVKPSDTSIRRWKMVMGRRTASCGG
jgi:hypothetical protein